MSSGPQLLAFFTITACFAWLAYTKFTMEASQAMETKAVPTPEVVAARKKQELADWTAAAKAAGVEGAAVYPVVIIDKVPYLVMGLGEEGTLIPPGGKVEMKDITAAQAMRLLDDNSDPIDAISSITATREYLEETGESLDRARLGKSVESDGPGSTGEKQRMYFVELSEAEARKLLKAKAPIGDGTLVGFTIIEIPPENTPFGATVVDVEGVERPLRKSVYKFIINARSFRTALGLFLRSLLDRASTSM